MKREDVNFLANLAKEEELEVFCEKVSKKFDVSVLSAPNEQTLLVPVKDPISGGSFYGGEVLVTSCLVQVDDTKGWSMIMDIDKKKAFYVAMLDACFAKDIFKSDIVNLLMKVENRVKEQKSKLNKKVNSTRVSFDLM